VIGNHKATAIGRLLLAAVALAVLVFGVGGALATRAKYSKARTDLAALQTDLRHFWLDNGRYPTTEEGLGTIFGAFDETDPGFVRGAPAQARPPLDPWGNRYFYESDSNSYVLGSFGPSGAGGPPNPALTVKSD
jgi:general secretion pathway protein G